MTALDTAPASPVGIRSTYRGIPHRRIPLRRIVTTEVRKMFDTRSGFWLMASIGILALLATSAVILFAPDDGLTYKSFATAISIPMTVVLPIIAILSVTGEWSQRSGLTTFTLVPHRGRVIAAKAISCVGVAVITIPLALGIGALGNVAGTVIVGVAPVWDLTVINLLTIVLANVLGLLVGFMLGVVIRGSAGALVAYAPVGGDLRPRRPPYSDRASCRAWWASACSPRISMTLPGLPPSCAAVRRRSRNGIAPAAPTRRCRWRSRRRARRPGVDDR